MTAIPHGISPLTAIAIAIRHDTDLLPEDDTADVTAVRANLSRIAAHLELALHDVAGPGRAAAAEAGLSSRLSDGWAEFVPDLTVGGPVTTIDLNAIRRREQGATPGPWGVGNGTHIVRGLEVTGRGSFTCIQSVAEIDDDDDRTDWGHDEAVEVNPEADAEFIAHARQDIPALLAEVDRLRAERVTTGELRQYLREADEQIASMRAALDEADAEGGEGR